DKKYDVIMVDAYQDITIPFQMSSAEFFTLVKEHLTEDGVMVVNMNMKGRAGHEKADINDYLADTISSVFDNVCTVDVEYSTNTELFASDNPGFRENLDANIELLEDAELKSCLRRADAGLRDYEAGNHVMTDDKAPVELLGMQVIDDIIKDEVSYYKKIYEEQGIQGIIDSL
ncbi:MAG: fused MFS/spermidine synthase, partial [Butyrivibrio sp.]|nr:fused MFS/spermidine synthase [Butyrivibrio sp.]